MATSVSEERKEYEHSNLYMEKSQMHSNGDDYKDSFSFPSVLPPSPEAMELTNWYNKDGMDLKIEEHLRKKYEKQINSFENVYEDTVIRFVCGYRHIAKSAKGFNARLHQTDVAFANYLKWKRDSDFDNILKREQINNVDIVKYIDGSYIYGQDKFGHPILWDEGLNFRKDSDLSIHRNCGEKGWDMALAFVIRLLHEMKVATNKHYKQNGVMAIFRHCLVFDLKDFNSKKVLKNRNIHEYYTKKGSLIAPEMVHKVYVINSPWVFQKIWKILKKFLHPNTIEKTVILGKDYLSEMTKEIDINMIPVKFGGKGKWTINVAGIPKGYPIQIVYL